MDLIGEADTSSITRCFTLEHATQLSLLFHDSLTGWEAAEVHRLVQILQLHSSLRLWVRKPSLVLIRWDLCRNLHVYSGVSVGRAAWWHTSGCTCRFPSVTWRRWAWHGWTRVCSESCSASPTPSRSAATRVSSCCCRRSASPVTLIRRAHALVLHMCDDFCCISVHLFLLLCVFLLSRNQPQSYRSFSSHFWYDFFSFSLFLFCCFFPEQ